MGSLGQVKVDKIYLETHRDLILVSDSTIEAAKIFFNSRGVKTLGGITLTVNEMNRFETFCYSNPEHPEKNSGNRGIYGEAFR